VNYKNIYNDLIKKRIENPINEGYLEKHHIIPRSLGGSDNPENLIKFSAREHFIAHYLLAKIYPKNSFEWYKMNHAFMIMKSESFCNDRYFNSRLYEGLRKNFSIVMSKMQSGKNNSQYGTAFYIMETATNIYEMKRFIKGEEPKGFISTKQWRKNNPKEKKEKKKKCKMCGQYTCSFKEICIQSRLINTFINFLGFDSTKKGTYAVYSEFDRIKDNLNKDYNLDKLSLNEIKTKYGFSSHQRVSHMLKGLGIEKRNHSEAQKLHKKKEKEKSLKCRLQK